jgi:hypothetical protein
MCRRDRKIIMLQKGQLFHNGRNGRYKGHYRTENCTNMQGRRRPPPEDKRPTMGYHHVLSVQRGRVGQTL